MTDELTVDTEEQRQQWIELLEVALGYHNEMTEELDDDDSITFHAGISRAILEAIWLIQTWEVEEIDPYESVIKDISMDKNLPPHHADLQKRERGEFPPRKEEIENESTPYSDD